MPLQNSFLLGVHSQARYVVVSFSQLLFRYSKNVSVIAFNGIKIQTLCLCTINEGIYCLTRMQVLFTTAHLNAIGRSFPDIKWFQCRECSRGNMFIVVRG